MTVMVLLRIFADLGFYYAFAATVSSALGGRFHFPALLLLAACYAACCRFREQKRRQRLVLALAALAVLLPAPWGDRLAYIPAWGYVVYLVRRGDRDLSRARQVEFFEYFIRGFLFFAFFWCAVRFVLTPIEGMETGEMIYAATHDFLAAGVPMALFGSTATMLFLRSIRHEPAVYLQPGFQAVNAGIVAAALVFCALLTSPLTVRLAAWVYSHLLIPILLVLFMMVGMALALTAPLIQLLVDLARRTGAEDTIQVLMEKINEFSASFQELFGIPPAEILLRGGGSILAVLAMAAGIVLLRLFLRWLVQRWRESAGAADRLPTRILSAQAAPASREEKRARNDVERVRQQYRAFLRLCQKRGMELAPSHTSADIGRSAARVLGPDLPLEEIGALYRRARYQGTTSRADAAQMKKLCAQVKRRRARSEPNRR
jgi:hypothetical protein